LRIKLIANKFTELAADELVKKLNMVKAGKLDTKKKTKKPTALKAEEPVPGKSRNYFIIFKLR